MIDTIVEGQGPVRTTAVDPCGARSPNDRRRFRRDQTKKALMVAAQRWYRTTLSSRGGRE